MQHNKPVLSTNNETGTGWILEKNAAFTNDFADNHVTGFRSGQILIILPSLIALTPVVQMSSWLTLIKNFKIHVAIVEEATSSHLSSANPWIDTRLSSLPSNSYLANPITAEKDPKKLFLSIPLASKCYVKSPAMLVDGKACRWRQKFSKLEVGIRLTICLYKMPWNIIALRRLFPEIQNYRPQVPKLVAPFPPYLFSFNKQKLVYSSYLPTQPVSISLVASFCLQPV